MRIVVTRQRSKVDRWKEDTPSPEKLYHCVRCVHNNTATRSFKKKCPQLTDSHGRTFNGAEQREEDREDIVKMMTMMMLVA